MVKAEVGLYNSRGRYSRSTDTNSNSENGRHNGQQMFVDVRITPFFIEPLDANVREKLTDPSGPLMRAINEMSSLLLVRPLRDNLTLTPSCRDTHRSGTNQGTCMELSSRTDCGIFAVPRQFVGTAVQCDTPDDPSTCHEEGPDGDGVATDFLVFVGTDSQQPSKNKKGDCHL